MRAFICLETDCFVKVDLSTWTTGVLIDSENKTIDTSKRLNLGRDGKIDYLKISAIGCSGCEKLKTINCTKVQKAEVYVNIQLPADFEMPENAAYMFVGDRIIDTDVLYSYEPIRMNFIFLGKFIKDFRKTDV